MRITITLTKRGREAIKVLADLFMGIGGLILLVTALAAECRTWGELLPGILISFGMLGIGVLLNGGLPE